MSFEPNGFLKLCRLCANTMEDTGHSITLFDKGNTIAIQQIKELTGLTLKDIPRRMLPRYLCRKCKEELPRACEFRRKIIKTQSYFKTQDYKNKFDTEWEGAKPTFAFVPFVECEIREAHETKPFSGEYKETSGDNLPAANCVETIIKEEIKDLNIQNLEGEDTNVSKAILGRNAHRKTLKNTDDRKEIQNSTKDNFECTKSSFDDNASDDSLSSVYSENIQHSDDPDFSVGLTNKDSKTELPSNSRNNEEPPDTLKSDKFSCHLCQRSFESLICLKIHFQKQHKGEKFKCDLCEEKFTTIKSLVRHFRLHQGEKEFKCHYCDLSFKYSTIRCRHERRMHSKDPPFLCFICGKTFITSTMGRDHMTVHTKERAFHCIVCKADFLRKSHLNTHYRSMTHKNNQQKLNQEGSIITVNDSQQCLEAHDQFLLNV